MKTYRCCSNAHRRELLTEARKRVAPKPSPINVALADATLEAAGKALLRANRVARIIKAIYRRRWRAFVASDKLDAALLTKGLRAELEAAIRGELTAVANATASVTMRAIADVVPVEAFLILHRKMPQLLKLTLPKPVLEGPQLDYAGEDSTADATETANAFVSLPTAAATNALVDEPFNGEAWTDRLKNWLPVEADIAREVSNGLSLGKSNREIAQALLPLVNDVAYKAERIARTEVHRVNVTAQMRSVDKALGPAIEGWRYTATLDDRTSQEHAALDGRIYPRGAEKPRLPSRPNCFVAGTSVRGVFVGGLKTWYAGPIVDVKTRSGRALTVTPNHPVLTSRGWIPVGDLREGDHLLTYGASVDGAAPSPNDENRPSVIEEVFDAFRAHGLLATKASALDLHGDAQFAQGEIYVVGADGVLDSHRIAGEDPEFFSKVSLPPPHVTSRSFPGSGAGDLGSHRVSLATTSLVRRAGLLPSRDGCHSGPLQQLRVGAPAWFDRAPKKLATDDVSRGANGVRDFLLARTGEISRDRVIAIKRGTFTGHVFDLQSTRGWYIANGVISSNCRCTYTPVMKSYADLGVPASMASILDEPFGGRAAQTWNKITKSMEGAALANDSRYPQWFNAQPIAKQREILGQRTFDAAQPKSGGKAKWSKAIAARGIAPPPPQTFDAPPPQPKFLGPIPGSNPDPEIPLIQIPPTPGAPPEKDEPIPAPPAGFKPTPAKKRKRRRPTA